MQKTINEAKQNAFNSLHEQIWFFPTYLGTLFLSEYFFELQALNLSE